MTTDLKSKTVEGLEDDMYSGWITRSEFADEMRRRLEEAQQRIVAQQARLQKFKQNVFEYLVVRGEATEEYANLMAHSALIQNDEAEANEAIAAHDAKLTALAKAEALEEARELAEMEANDYNESEGIKFAELKTDAESALNSFAVALGAKAAEYRAKAKDRSSETS